MTGLILIRILLGTIHLTTWRGGVLWFLWDKKILSASLMGKNVCLWHGQTQNILKALDAWKKLVFIEKNNVSCRKNKILSPKKKPYPPLLQIRWMVPYYNFILICHMNHMESIYYPCTQFRTYGFPFCFLTWTQFNVSSWHFYAWHSTHNTFYVQFYSCQKYFIKTA